MWSWIINEMIGRRTHFGIGLPYTVEERSSGCRPGGGSDMWPASAAITRYEIFAIANPISGAVTLLAYITRLQT